MFPFDSAPQADAWGGLGVPSWYAMGMTVAAGQVYTFPIRSNKFSMNVEVREVLYSQETEFQKIDILDTLCFGRMLLLDGHIQLTELDEAVYHEALVHVPLLSVNDPKKALVVGGGDGGVLRELLRWPDLEIDMVEIDMGVIDASRAQLPFLNEGCFESPRVNLFVQDAFPFVKDPSRGPYDLIVMDSTDTYEDEEGEISAMLFTEQFYQDCKKLLAPGGFVVTQADNLVFCPYSLEQIRADYAKVFANVGSYHAFVPSFGGFSGYCWASDSNSVRAEFNHEKAKTLNLKTLNAHTYAVGQSPLPYQVTE